MKLGKIVQLQYLPSPCGELLLGSVGNELCLCDWASMPCSERYCRRLSRLLGAEFREEPSAVIDCAAWQLEEYFAGKRREFSIKLRPVGTVFQQRVWQALLTIPYGQTCSYIDVARSIGCERGVRAVAQAIGANALAVFIPCHRVVGADGSLTGFAGGLQAKRRLLEVEGVY